MRHFKARKTPTPLLVTCVLATGVATAHINLHQKIAETTADFSGTPETENLLGDRIARIGDFDGFRRTTPNRSIRR
ncbi:MAG: hypothetical protein GY722_13860 [bacterium]|nr:hypothetical protein [bacterium]